MDDLEYLFNLEAMRIATVIMLSASQEKVREDKEARQEEGLLAMPKGTKVHEMYEAMKEKGYSVGKAARIAQSKTGKALATGKKPKGKR